MLIRVPNTQKFKRVILKALKWLLHISKILITFSVQSNMFDTLRRVNLRFTSIELRSRINAFVAYQMGFEYFTQVLTRRINPNIRSDQFRSVSVGIHRTSSDLFRKLIKLGILSVWQTDVIDSSSKNSRKFCGMVGSDGFYYPIDSSG